MRSKPARPVAVPSARRDVACRLGLGPFLHEPLHDDMLALNKQGLSIRFEGAWTDQARQIVGRALLTGPEPPRAAEPQSEEGWLCLCGHVDGRLYFLARETSSRATFEAASAEDLAAQIEQHLSPTEAAASPVKLLLIEAHGDARIAQHPDVAPWLERGWQVKSVTPRVIEALGPRQLVVLTPPADDGEAP